MSVTLLAAITTFTAVLAFASYRLAGFVINELFTERYSAAIPVAQAFCVTAVLMTSQLTLANFIVIPGKRTPLLIKSSTTALSISLCLQLLLIPYFGAVGAVFARTAAELSVLAILMWATYAILRKT